ncbi:MAG: hypothetical protein KGS48_14885 [Bacteroidetes bacterium]|nr:hypothetical protein [Bacteroidota bacterium]
MTTSALKSPIWFKILLGLYALTNLFIGILWIAFPVIIAGLNSLFTPIQLFFTTLFFLFIKIAVSILLLDDRNTWGMVGMLILASIWDGYMAFPFFRHNWASGICVLDVLVLGAVLYLFQPIRK